MAARPWWAVPLVVLAVGLAGAALVIRRTQSEDAPWLAGGSMAVLGVLVALMYAAGCLYLLPLRRRHWPLYVGGVALFGLLAGLELGHLAQSQWQTCALSEIGSLAGLAECGPHIELEQRLHDWLLPGAPLLMITCWLLAAPGWLVGLGHRLGARPRFIAAALALINGAIVTGGVLGWHSYHQGVEHDRRIAAERALAQIVLPQQLRSVGPSPWCTPRPAIRCATSALLPAQLKQQLSLLVRTAKVRETCAETRIHQPCGLVVTGRIGGLPAVVLASSQMLRLKRGESPPAGAVHCCSSIPVFFAGSDVTIFLLTAED